MIEAHFNAIICEIKTQLGFNTPTLASTQSSPSSISSIGGTTSPASVTAGAVTPTHSTTVLASPASATNQSSGNTLTNVFSGTGTINIRLRDACCLAIASLTTHPAATKRLAGHLPALLSGLLGLIDDHEGVGGSPVPLEQLLQVQQQQQLTKRQKSILGHVSPAEEAAIAVQKVAIAVKYNFRFICHAAIQILPVWLLFAIIHSILICMHNYEEFDPIFYHYTHETLGKFT
ncbi:unnamed protein product [Protopolystoma xenopodis]|uniref:Uncharacterized protein n=1 Tax=Protopolystoma xenopodis TaxID=117903 RepID=A0A448WCY1_9PLAT|nr:unnamed protein product [Protopolystoma xenopodis]